MHTRGRVRAWSYADDSGRPVATEVFDRVPESVAEARQFVAEFLERWQMAGVADKAKLVASELAANAVLHARRTAFRVTVRRLSDTWVRIEVVDLSRVLPVQGAPGTDEVHGLGLALVDIASRCWGADPLPWGKRVWAEVGEDRHQSGPVEELGEVPRWHTRTAQAIYSAVLVAAAGAVAYGVCR